MSTVHLVVFIAFILTDCSIVFICSVLQLQV